MAKRERPELGSNALASTWNALGNTAKTAEITSLILLTGAEYLLAEIEQVRDETETPPSPQPPSAP